TVRGLRRDATARTVTRIRPAQVNARRLRGHVDDLDAIAAALDAVGAPLGARAAALVQLLVADGAGPLYNPARGDDLPAALARVRRAVDG
ncbi:MAG TPA: hypothetical protein VMU66_03350, partial [Gaiellales bacterium]|nr:hypothetical protein [Gaiellales bacterium]